MRVFLLSVFAAFALAAVTGVTLTSLNESTATANSSPVSVRLDQQEAVSWYAREVEQQPVQPRG